MVFGPLRCRAEFVMPSVFPVISHLDARLGLSRIPIISSGYPEWPAWNLAKLISESLEYPLLGLGILLSAWCEDLCAVAASAPNRSEETPN